MRVCGEGDIDETAGAFDAVTPSNHSPEAIAAYPMDDDFYPVRERRQIEHRRTAFDAGVAATHAQQYAATREAIAQVIFNSRGGSGKVWPEHPEGSRSLAGQSWHDASALLATPGPLLDAAEVWDAGFWANDSYNSASDPIPTNPYREARP